MYFFCSHFSKPTPVHPLPFLDFICCHSLLHLKFYDLCILKILISCFSVYSHHFSGPSSPSSPPPPPALVSSITAHDSRSANMAFSSRFSFWEQKGSLIWTFHKTLLHCMVLQCFTLCINMCVFRYECLHHISNLMAFTHILQ